MVGTQVVITNMTPDEVANMVKGIVQSTVRDELSRFAKEQEITSELPEYLTTRHVTEILGISRVSLQKWSKDTDKRSAILVPLKIGGSVRYRRDDVLNAFREMRRYAGSK